jgi:N-acetylglucosamine kinase-like BadF-type ATPase
MILIADSGATKADWALINGKEETRLVHTRGFNPVVHPRNIFAEEVDKLTGDLLTGVTPDQIFYYGAGCWDARRKQVIREVLAAHWPEAEIEVMHDLLAAARSTCGRDPGIACILGTGSNTCLYDGETVIDNVTNLGYLLGDEGSGSDLGRRFLRAYYYRELDEKLNAAFEEWNMVDAATVRDQIYESEMPNTYLASFTRFMGEHKEHPQIQRLIYDGFADFLDRHVRKYEGHLSLPVHFIGSIAFHFQDILLAVLHERNMHEGKFIQKPIDELVAFHSQPA